jgi:hypothetical protein
MNPKSWKTEVCTMYQGQDTWDSNALRFATKKEAEKYGDELLSRWMVPIASRAVESDDPITHIFDDSIGQAREIKTN